MRFIHGLGILGALMSTSLLASPHFDGSQKPYATSGIVSVAPQQFAQLNVFNAGVAGKDVCNLTLAFFDNNNQAVGVPQDLVIDGGETLSVTTEVVVDAVKLVRAVVDFSNQKNLVPGGWGRVKACAQIIPTFEVADSTGNKFIDTHFRFFGMPNGISAKFNGKRK